MPNELTARKAIKGWLGSNDKNQRWLASKLGISESLLSDVLSGYRDATKDVADDIQKITGIDIREFSRVA